MPDPVSSDQPYPRGSGAVDLEPAVYRKVTRRLIPFLFLCYILSYIDRVNVGFAKLQMQQDLGMSDTVFGLGMGIFFIGYFFFEVPSNMILQRVGARFWIGPIMIVWGLVSSAFMFAKTPFLFYSLRFLLGIVESGFFPGVVLYLTFWYPGKYRAKMVAAFMSAIGVSGAFGGPVSGWIMRQLDQAGGLQGWQWLFLLEGIPSAVVGVAAIFYLDDGPAQARWLEADERALLLARLAEEEQIKQGRGAGHHRLMDAFGRWEVWALCGVYFGVIVGLYYVSFWMPQIIQDNFTKDPWRIGLLSMVPWGFGAAAMIAWGHHSDAMGERRWHLVLPLLAAGVFLMLGGTGALPPALGLTALAFITAGIMAGISTFWAVPTGLLSGTAAAAGIAWINSVGNLGGFVSPYAIGWIRDRSTNPMYPAALVSCFCVLSAALALVVTRRVRLPSPGSRKTARLQ